MPVVGDEMKIATAIVDAALFDFIGAHRRLENRARAPSGGSHARGADHRMRRGPHGLNLHRPAPGSEISCGAFLPNARPLRRTLRHRVAAAQGVACLGGAPQLAVLKPEHHAGSNWNALAESALVRG